jgi:formylglycine-generating enzyme required for sulfatase activity
VGRRRDVDERALLPRDGQRALFEIDRLWQGEASGAHPQCRSTFGVYDLTGNVDEWTSSVNLGERPSILKGGYWGPVRTRCQSSTRAHGEDYSYYQQGFRCCQELR